MSWSLRHVTAKGAQETSLRSYRGHRLAYRHPEDLDVLAERLETQVVEFREVPL